MSGLSQKNLVRGQKWSGGAFLVAKNCPPGPGNVSVIGPSVPKVVLRGESFKRTTKMPPKM